MNSGDVIKTLAGTSVVLPFANEHPCFGQRQGWCKNLASWRLEGDSLILHFCDACKPRITIHGAWTKLAVKEVTLRTAYFTFGQSHFHEYGSLLLDKDCVLKITAADPRAKMFETFGRKWAMQYEEPPDMKHFPRGIIELP